MSAPVRLGSLWRDELKELERAKVIVNANVKHLQLAQHGQAMQSVDCRFLMGRALR